MKSVNRPEIGTVIGRLTIVAEAEPYLRGKYFIRRMLCRCSCGKEVTTYASWLTEGNKKTTKSCGCLRNESNVKRSTTHGRSDTREYSIWSNMKDRCLNVNTPCFKSYGGSGITICDTWVSSFEDFLEDMGKCPEGCSIDRIDNSKGYSKDNCRWATQTEQVRNRSTTKSVTYLGEVINLGELAIKVGIKYHTLWARIYSHGWSVEDSVAAGKGKSGIRRNCKDFNKTAKA